MLDSLYECYPLSRVHCSLSIMQILKIFKVTPQVLLWILLICAQKINYINISAAYSKLYILQTSKGIFYRHPIVKSVWSVQQNWISVGVLFLLEILWVFLLSFFLFFNWIILIDLPISLYLTYTTYLTP